MYRGTNMFLCNILSLLQCIANVKVYSPRGTFTYIKHLWCQRFKLKAEIILLRHYKASKLQFKKTTTTVNFIQSA